MSIDLNQLKQGIHALYAYLASRGDRAEKSSLFEEDESILLSVGLKKIPTVKSNKPILIPLAHPLHNGDDTQICLFTKDSKEGKTSIKEQLEQQPVEGITKVIPISKLRKNYHQYADRRKLLQEFGAFMADERIIPLLPGLLGVKFFEKKKQPIPVVLNGKFRDHLAAARDSTYMFLSTGPSVQVRIARSSMSRVEVAENITGAIQHIVDHIPQKWKNVQNIHIKTHNSMAMPIFNSLPIDNKIEAPKITTPKQQDKKQRQKPERALKRKADDVEVSEDEISDEPTPKKAKAAQSTNGTAKKVATPAKTAANKPTTPVKSAANPSSKQSSTDSTPAKPTAKTAKSTPAASKSNTPEKSAPVKSTVKAAPAPQSNVKTTVKQSAVKETPAKSTKTPAKAAASSPAATATKTPAAKTANKAAASTTKKSAKKA